MALILGFFLVNCILCSVYATSTDTFLITTAIFMGFVLLDRERK